MRFKMFAGGFAALCCLGSVPVAVAFPAAPVVDQQAVTPLETIRTGPGHYRTKLYRQRMRHYKNNPGARFELQQQRTRFCRRSPSRC